MRASESIWIKKIQYFIFNSLNQIKGFIMIWIRRVINSQRLNFFFIISKVQSSKLEAFHGKLKVKLLSVIVWCWKLQDYLKVSKYGKERTTNHYYCFVIFVFNRLGGESEFIRTHSVLAHWMHNGWLSYLFDSIAIIGLLTCFLLVIFCMTTLFLKNWQ